MSEIKDDIEKNVKQSGASCRTYRIKNKYSYKLNVMYGEKEQTKF